MFVDLEFGCNHLYPFGSNFLVVGELFLDDSWICGGDDDWRNIWKKCCESFGDLFGNCFVIVFSFGVVFEGLIFFDDLLEMLFIPL